MAFISIKNPTRRREIVQEYIRIRDKIRGRNENNKEGNLIKEQQIEEQFRPIVTATEKSADQITSALREKEEKTPYEFYSSLVRNKDKQFGIYRKNDGFYRLGNTDIKIDGDYNIDIDDTVYGYTTGLWDLIMLNNPNDGDYTEDDLDAYKEIVKKTELMDNPRLVGPGTRYKNTAKYKFLEKLFILPKRKRARTVDSVDSEDAPAEGLGIILPGNINSLRQRLQLVCGERAAGNIEATTPEIAAILDELLRRNHISKPEYNAVCKKLGC